MNMLTNEPIGEDWYDGHAQTELARRIAQEIRQPSTFVGPDGNEQEHTVVMALEGSWGSGKSNVIRMVENDQTFTDKKSTGEVVFINYDLWKYRQDLTRKSVLESIVSELADRNILTGKLKEKLLRLTGERIRGSVIETPRMSWTSFVFIGINVVLVALSIWNSIRKDLFSWELTSLQVAFGLIIAGLCRFVENEYRKLKDYSFETFRHVDEPLVTDFTGYLQELAKELMGEKDNCGPWYLVLVFDNLDRLSNEEIQKFWAATHVLFAERRTKRPRNIQVIIPYDRERMRKAFGLPLDGDEYIRKVVDKVFVMPEVVMTDWSSFLKSRLKSVFDSLDESQLSDVVRVFDWLNRPGDLTPRAMISFINDMVSACESMRYDEAEHGRSPIPLGIIALYVLGWRRFEKLSQVDNVELLIVSGAFIPETAKIARQWYLGDLNHCTQMAAVVYQVPESKAAEILMYQQVGASLDGNMSLGCVCGQPGFHQVFSSVIKHVKQFERVPQALATIDTPDLQQYWDEYYDVKRDEIISSHGNAPILSQGEALMFAHITKWQDYYMRLIKHLHADKSITFNENLQVQFAESVEEVLRKSGRTLVGNFARSLVEPEEFVKYLKVAQENFRLLNMHCDCSKLDNWFDQNLGNGCEIYVCNYLSREYLAKMPKTVARMKAFDKLSDEQALEMITGLKLPQS